MGASGAKYGIATSHFYWVGAIPAMVFVGVFMMPFYYGSRARSVPGIPAAAVRREDSRLQRHHLRGDDGLLVGHLDVRAWPSCSSLLLGLGLRLSACWSAAGRSCSAYIYLGGLTSAIYNEVLQFFLIVARLSPLVLLGLQDVGGWDGLQGELTASATHAGYAAGRVHALLGATWATPAPTRWASSGSAW